MFQCDGGGEFINNNLMSHLSSHGIKQLVSCPHTPQQNGIAERKHRHITELGMSMLFHGKVPQQFWLEAFFTSCFLGNLLPSSKLSGNKSPYEALFNKRPEYSALRIFGSACYPSLRPYASNKLDPKSLQCVFVGYNEKYKGYRCLHPPTGKVYINKHVLFDEQVFPFASTYSHLQQQHATPLTSAWQQSFLHSQLAPDTHDTSRSQNIPNPPQPSSESHQGVSPLQYVPHTGSLHNTFPPVEENTQESNSTGQASVTEKESDLSNRSTDPGNVSVIQFGNLPLTGLDNLPQRQCRSTPAMTRQEETSSASEASPQASSSKINSPEQSQNSAAPDTPSKKLILPPPTTSPTHQSQHPMITRSKAGITKPNPRYVLFTVTTTPATPRTVTEALKHPGWNGAMTEEMVSFDETDTFTLVPYHPDMHILGCRWIFRVKLNDDGTVKCLRSRLVVKGYDQEEGIDYLDTYSPVVKSPTIRAMLHLATVNKWEIKQLDVKHVFLYGDLTETVFMHQPPGFINPEKPGYVCKLNKAIYGLKQAPRARFNRFSDFLLDFGFICSLRDPSLFIYRKNGDIMLLLLYVDDIALTGSNNTLISKLIEALNIEFKMKDLGCFHYFLGLQTHFHSTGLFLNQEKYAEDLLHIVPFLDPT